MQKGVRKIVNVLFFLLLSLTSFAQYKQGEYEIEWGSEAYSIIQSKDDGYVLAGYNGNGNGDFYIVKLDSNANLKWTRTIGGATISAANSVIQTNDGGYAATGYCTAYGAGGEDVYVVRLDHLGNVVWTKTIGGPDDDWGNSIVQTYDGGFAITGGTKSFGGGTPGSADVYVIKLDSLGNKKWTKTVEGPWGSNDEGRSIIQTNDSGYAVTGSTFNTIGGDAFFLEYLISYLLANISIFLIL